MSGDDQALWQAISRCERAIASHAAAHEKFAGQFNLHDERHETIIDTLVEMKEARLQSNEKTAAALEKINTSIEALRTEMSENRGAKGALKWIIGLFGATAFGVWLKHTFGGG